MKKATITIPLNRADATSDFFGTNGIITLLCYSINDDFFSAAKLTIHCAIPEDKEAAFKAEFANYLKK